MIEWTFLKALILINQVNQESAMFVTVIFEIKCLGFTRTYGISVMMYLWCL